MSITIYHLKNCDTCKKAIKAIEANGTELTKIDVRADGVNNEDLVKFAEAVGFEKLLNTRSTTWRGLSETDKADIDLQKALALIGEHPTLMKRPVIMDTDGDITVGWTKEIQAKFG
ncbi:MAG: Spx/MgsR family RNA polymerase-binding regulatory protein [Rhizobiales bacterium]|nr:Spx/MgsR family RNA polymerase-binding regulatory protein [Hyphomicrobiales bacterium]